MLCAADVWFGYDEQKPVLRGVSLEIPSAGIVGILGPNGSGKTTLLRMLAGTRQPQRGSVTLEGTRCPLEALVFQSTVGEWPASPRLPMRGRVQKFFARELSPQKKSAREARSQFGRVSERAKKFLRATALTRWR